MLSYTLYHRRTSLLQKIEPIGGPGHQCKISLFYRGAQYEGLVSIPLGMLSCIACCSDPEACRAEAQRSVRPAAGSVSTTASLAALTRSCKLMTIASAPCCAELSSQYTSRCCHSSNAGCLLLRHRVLISQHRGRRTEQGRAQHRCVQTLQNVTYVHVPMLHFIASLVLFPIRRVWTESVHLSLQVQQATARSIALPDLFADSPDCLDDLDVDNAVSAHQHQVAQPQALQSAATAAHAACHISQQPQHASSKQVPGLKSGSSASLLGSAVPGVSPSATAAAVIMQPAGERSAAPVVLHASAAPHEPVLNLGPAGVGSRSSAPHAVQQEDSSSASELCSHGVPMPHCRLKQDHINHINAELVDFLMQKRVAPPGAIERLTAQRDAIQRALDREKEVHHAEPGQQNSAAVRVLPSNACIGQQNLPSTSYAARLGSSRTPEELYSGSGMAGHASGPSPGNSRRGGSLAAGAPASATTWQAPAAQRHHSYEAAGRGGASSGQGLPAEHSSFGHAGPRSTWHEGGSRAAGQGSFESKGGSFGQDGPRTSWQENGGAAGMASYERVDLSSIPDPALRQSFDQNVEEVATRYAS